MGNENANNNHAQEPDLNQIRKNNPRDTWTNIPLQDFTDNSEIDWTKSIKEIDQQLYEKYGLTAEEIDFIENNVQAME